MTAWSLVVAIYILDKFRSSLPVKPAVETETPSETCSKQTTVIATASDTGKICFLFNSIIGCPQGKKIAFGKLCDIIMGKINSKVAASGFEPTITYITTWCSYIIFRPFSTKFIREKIGLIVLSYSFFHNFSLVLYVISSIFETSIFDNKVWASDSIFFLFVQVHKENIPVQRQGRSKILHSYCFMSFIAIKIKINSAFVILLLASLLSQRYVLALQTILLWGTTKVNVE